MQTVQQLLAGKKSNETWALHPDQTVIEALEMMSEKNIGAVMLMEDGRLAGIFSERDYARRGILQGRKAKSTPLRAVMTKDVFTVRPDQTIQDCMEMMSTRRCRHLPVSDGDTVVGLLSISDIVTALLHEQEGHIENLHRYIRGY